MDEFYFSENIPTNTDPDISDFSSDVMRCDKLSKLVE